MPSLWGSFTGSTASRKLADANAQATNYLNQAKTDSVRETNAGYDRAQGYLSPYATAGNQASTMYNNALGINGAGAQRQFADSFQGWNPYAQAESDMAGRMIARRGAAQGFGGSSGVTQLALARAGMERGGQDWRDYLNALGGQAQQGAQFAGQQAGLATGQGNSLANIYAGFGQQNAANAINYGNAAAANSNVFGQNMLGMLGLGMQGYGAMNGVQPRGGTTSPGTAANGGWSTTTTPANNFFGLFGR